MYFPQKRYEDQHTSEVSCQLLCLVTKEKLKLPDFESSIFVTGQIVRPLCVLPLFGLKGQQLWGSQISISSGRVELPQSMVKVSLKGIQSKTRSISQTLRVPHEGKSDYQDLRAEKEAQLQPADQGEQKDSSRLVPKLPEGGGRQ